MKLVNILADNEYLNDVLLKLWNWITFIRNSTSKFVDSVPRTSVITLSDET